MLFLELSCFFDDPADVGNLISGSSAFSKTSLNIRKFMVHILLKPDLEERSLVFPILFFSPFLCIVHLGTLSYLSLLFFGTPHSYGCIFPFLICLSLLFFTQLFARPPQTTFCLLHLLFLRMVLITTSFAVLQTSIHTSSGTLSITSNPVNLFVTSTI